MDLVEILPNIPYVILADSFYGSLSLAEELQEKDRLFILCCRGDRPSQIFNDYLARNLPKGSWKYMHKKEILATGFYDVKKVMNYFVQNTLLTFHIRSFF